MTERLDRILSHHGFGTRKEVRKYLAQGRVTIDEGEVVKDCSFHLNPDEHRLFVDGTEIILKENVYLMMNKPQNVVCANKDGLHSTVFELLSQEYQHSFLGGNLHLVGRLDIDTEGLLLFTTDGTLTHRLLSPKTHVPKTYLVHLEKACDAAEQARIASLFKEGIFCPHEGNEPGFTAQSAQVVFDSETVARLSICEGKYHQVKRMFAAAGNKVVFLKRISMAELKLDESLKAGEYRELTEQELKLLKN